MGRDLNERVELRTERLLLRPFEFGDVDDVASYASDSEVGRYLPLPQPYTRDDAVEFIAREVLAEWSTRPTFAIVLGGTLWAASACVSTRRTTLLRWDTCWERLSGARD